MDSGARGQSPAVSPAPQEPTDASRAQRFEAIFRAELRYLWNVLRRLGVPHEDLEDLAHEVLVAVYRKLDEYSPERPLRPWLFGFAYRTVLHYRRRPRRPTEPLDESLSDAAPRPDEQLAMAQDRALVQQALDAMDFDRRAVFVMHDLDGCTSQQIADTLGIPLGTAYSRLRLGREEFAAAVQRLRLRRGEP